MKKLILFILSAGISFGAITEKYVSSSANEGTSDGTVGAPYSWAEMLTEINATGAAGNRYNVKADGTYTRSASETFSAGGSLTAPVIIRGYSSTITDGYQGRSPENGVLVETNMPLVSFSGGNYAVATSGDYIQFENIRFTFATLGLAFSMDQGVSLVNCKVTNSSTDGSASAVQIGVRSSVINSDIYMTGASGGTGGVLMSGALGRMIASRSKVTSAAAYSVRLTGGAVLLDTVCIGGNGVRVNDVSATPVLYGNTIVSSAGDGLSFITGINGPQLVMNCHITDNTGGGIDLTDTGVAAILMYNRFRDNAADIQNGNDWVTATDVGNIPDNGTDTTTTDYENFGAGDYRLKTTAPGTSAGQPTQKSIGAYQLDQTGAGAAPTEKSHTFVQ